MFLSRERLSKSVLSLAEYRCCLWRKPLLVRNLLATQDCGCCKVDAVTWCVSIIRCCTIALKFRLILYSNRKKRQAEVSHTNASMKKKFNAACFHYPNKKSKILFRICWCCVVQRTKLIRIRWQYLFRKCFEHQPSHSFVDNFISDWTHASWFPRWKDLVTANNCRCFCSPNWFTVTHEYVLKPIHTVFVGRVIHVNVITKHPSMLASHCGVEFILKTVKPA